MRKGKFWRILLLALLLSSSWLFSGWPQIWQNPRIPPKITQVKADTVTYYFNARNNNGLFNEGVGMETSLIVDGNIGTYGRDNVNTHYVTLTGNDCPGTNLGTITAVSVGFYWTNNSTLANIKGRIAPYFGGSSAGNNHDATVDPAGETSGNRIWEDFDITTDTNAPSPWIWSDVQNLDARLTTVRGSTGRWNPYSVRIIVTYTPDTSPPTPNPMTFSSAPANDSTTQISMTSTTGTDSTGPVNYLFTSDNSSCGVNAGTEGTSSSWQASTSYSDSGLQPNQCYGYTVQARDSVSPTPNTGTASSISSTYTSANIPGTPALGNATKTTLRLTNDVNSNPASNPTTYFAVQVVTTTPTDSNWLNKWVDASGNSSVTAVWQIDTDLDALSLQGLQPGTLYGVKVKARNQDNDETSLSAEGQATTTADIISITITSDKTVDYGILAASAQKNTLQLSDTQTAQNSGDVAEDFNIMTSNGIGGVTWTAGTSVGSNTFVHEFSITGDDSGWATFTSYTPMATNIAVGNSQNFNLRITAPTHSDDYLEKTITVTIQAVKH